jgi:putative membrane protein
MFSFPLTGSAWPRRQAMLDGRALGPAVSAACVLATGILVLSQSDIGPLTLQMAQHLFVMNVAAPLAAVFFTARLPGATAGAAGFWIVALAQISILWLWHWPAVQTAAASSFALHLLLSAVLGAAALAFWTLVLEAAHHGRWHAILALLVTGKLACLLGVLMIFAPRDLYGLPGLLFPLCSTGPSTLQDQQLAGLLMITACPLSYLVAGVVFAAQMLARLERRFDSWRFPLASR